MFALIPYGKFPGIIKRGLNYHPDAPFNLAVAAAGPSASKNLSILFLPVAVILIAWGLLGEVGAAVYVGRLCMGLGVVGLLDFLIADPGKYQEFRRRERLAQGRARETEGRITGTWIEEVVSVKEKMQKTRMQRVIRKDGKVLWAPWQFRNSGMGGRHTEREYPESNISMQETMFVPLSAGNYEDAQEMTVKLQNRLKEIIENAEGCRVMGIGLEGGLAAYITKGQQELVPEQRLWRMAKQAIIECGYLPGKDVALALDAAAAELELAYREEYEQPDVVGMYLFWRDEEKTVMSTDELFELYRRIIEEDDIPFVSIEDGFGEDQRGWALITEKLGDKIFIIADDLVTTKDSSIEYAADHNLSNTLLCKANQIGTLSETLLAILVALGKGLNIVVSHRSKSPNDDMEAQLGLASFEVRIHYEGLGRGRQGSRAANSRDKPQGFILRAVCGGSGRSIGDHQHLRVGGGNQCGHPHRGRTDLVWHQRKRALQEFLGLFWRNAPRYLSRYGRGRAPRGQRHPPEPNPQGGISPFVCSVPRRELSLQARHHPGPDRAIRGYDIEPALPTRPKV
jgi:hypothetical protein